MQIQTEKCPSHARLSRLRKSQLLELQREMAYLFDIAAEDETATKTQLTNFIRSHWDAFQQAKIAQSAEPTAEPTARSAAADFYEGLLNLAADTEDSRIRSAASLVGSYCKDLSVGVLT